MKHSKYSAVIIGSGIAGLLAAIKLYKEASLPRGVLIVTKSQLAESNSKYAQGGMVSVLPENKLDSYSLHIEDTIKAGAGLTDVKTAAFISQKSAEAVKELQNLGVDFDRDENKKLKFTKEAAHSVSRILHAGGDATGFCIENALVNYLLSKSKIDVKEKTPAVEILTDDNHAAKGIIAYNYENSEYEIIESPAVIIASGGTGNLYQYTTNPDGASGSGIALAYRAGAIVKDMEFVQFHPTAFALGGKGRMFLISEAVRGEGAKLVLADSGRFMDKYDSRLELAPRDVVTRAVYAEMQKNNVKNVYLDARCIDEETFKKRFPTIYGACREYNINPAFDLIPVSPAAHYFMGGIKTGADGASSIKGLYAIGEAACTGLHGANRLASNSILECAVTACELVNRLKNTDLSDNFVMDSSISKMINCYEEKLPETDINAQEMISELKRIMQENAGIVRTEQKLLEGQKKINDLKNKFGFIHKCPDNISYELRDMLLAAGLITEFALERRESRGAHYRSDYPSTDKTAYSNEKSIFTNK